VRLHVLTWNLYHGRSVPPCGRDLLAQCAAAVAGWDWDVALLQEVPPWWPPELARAAGAESRSVLTSRNFLLPMRRAIATRRPDVIKSNGGGANAILVRGGVIAEQRSQRLCLLPERRYLHAVRLQSGPWVGNLHATVHDTPAAVQDAERAWGALRRWAGSAPVVLGGDFNVRAPSLEGLRLAGGHDVDHVFAGGLVPTGVAEVLERGRLSDHAPVRVGLAAP